MSSQVPRVARGGGDWGREPALRKKLNGGVGVVLPWEPRTHGPAATGSGSRLSREDGPDAAGGTELGFGTNRLWPAWTMPSNRYCVSRTAGLELGAWKCKAGAFAPWGRAFTFCGRGAQAGIAGGPRSARQRPRSRGRGWGVLGGPAPPEVLHWRFSTGSPRREVVSRGQENIRTSSLDPQTL